MCWYNNVKASICSVLMLALASACGPVVGDHQNISKNKAEQTNGGPNHSGQSQGQNEENKKITFSDVKPIFESKCARCHNSGANDWKIESNILRVIRSGALLQRLSPTAGPLSMPPQSSPESSAFSGADRSLILAYVEALSAPPSSGNNSNSGNNNNNSNNTPPPVIDGPEVVRDMRLAMLNRCTSCHGLQGNSIAASIPNLAGHDQTYIVNRVKDFLRPQSPSIVMQMTVQNLLKDFNLNYSVDDQGQLLLSTEADQALSFLANYFSNLKVTPSAIEFQSARSNLTEEQMQIFEKGKQIVAEKNCRSCHLGAGLQPLATMPMIFGQKFDYMVTALSAFKAQKRGATMPMLIRAYSLSDEDLKAIATYLSQVHPSEL